MADRPTYDWRTPMPSHAVYDFRAPSPWTKARGIGSPRGRPVDDAWRGAESIETADPTVTRKVYRDMPGTGSFLERVRTFDELLREVFLTLDPGAASPGSHAAQAVGMMTTSAKVRMYAAGQLALGRAKRIVVYQLQKMFPELKAEKIVSQVEAGAADLERVIRDSGGKAVDLAHYRRLITQGIWNKGWYEDGVELAKTLLPVKKGEKILNVATGLTWRQRRFISILATFGTNAPPQLNYQNAVRLADHLKKAKNDQDLLKGYPWGLTSYTTAEGREAAVPGLQALKSVLKGEGFGGRKIESYDLDLARETRPGFANQPIVPLTADRHQFRAVGLPTEEVRRDAAGNVLRNPKTHRPLTVPQSTTRTTARGSVYMGTSGLANSAYEIQEVMVGEMARQLGLTTEQAQAAMWTSKIARDFQIGTAPEQGYPFMQQHRLAEAQRAGAMPTSDVIRERAKEIAGGARTGGATVHQRLGDLMGQDVTAVSAFPERTRYLPPSDANLEDRIASYIRDNQDVLQDPNVAVGAYRYKRGEQATPIKLGDRELPTGTDVLDLVLTPPNLPGSRPTPAETVGLAAGQQGVYNLASGVADSARFAPTYGTGTAPVELPPLYARLALAEPDAWQGLVHALTGPGVRLSTQQRQLLSRIIQEVEVLRRQVATTPMPSHATIGGLPR